MEQPFRCIFKCDSSFYSKINKFKEKKMSTRITGFTIKNLKFNHLRIYCVRKISQLSVFMIFLLHINYQV